MNTDKNQKMWIRIGLWGIWALVCGMLMIHCGPPPTCKPEDRVSDFTINPNGSRCQIRCECNNQMYEGFCNNQGFCDSVLRGDCSKAGIKTGCFVRPKPEGNEVTCRSGAGIKICKPDYLRLSKWGDCELINKIEPEDTRDRCSDGIDNDCDGRVDRADDGCEKYCFPGETRTCYTGPENTLNVGSCAAGRMLCDPVTREWPAASKTTCVYDVTPQEEVCNGRDDDCDGLVDEDLPQCLCEQQGAKEPCYTGPEGTENRGICQTGFRVCEEQDDKMKRWSVCKGQTLPKAKEECNGLDDNCNGLVDEECPCQAGEVQACGANVGECREGQQRCEHGLWSGLCQGETVPIPEQCDGKDNNCNGRIDEYIPSRRCKTACGDGIESCRGGRWICEGPQPKPEICNNQDDDCNGKIDDGIVRECQTACGPGGQICFQGQWGQCVPHQTPPEVCDGKDNDCNGKIDDGLVKDCQTACGQGTDVCVAGKWQGCSAPKPTPEICDGLDNDCDGKVDNDPKCVCKPGDQQDCYRGKIGCTAQPNGGLQCHAPCATGKQTCINGQWGVCVGDQLPTAEICDNIDNDCNGVIDDNLTRPCFSGNTGCQLQTDGTYRCTAPCAAGTQTCQAGQWGACTGETLPQPEVCDGKDNDCDGKIDDGLTQTCKTACGEGIEFCRAGQWLNCTAPPVQKERCNNIDDDCNGVIDDNLPQPPCTSICGEGKLVCEQGLSNCKIQKPNQEICNGVDDDCNGKVDDNVTELGKSCTDTTAKGECQKGVYTGCVAGVPVCKGGTPAMEVCNGKDDDCNGQIDDGAKGCVITIAGTCGSSGNQNGNALQAKFWRPIHAHWAMLRNTNTQKDEESVLVADFGNHQIRRFDVTTDQVSTWVGDVAGTSGYVNGTRLSTKLFLPSQVAGPDEFGNFFITDQGNHLLRKVDSTGQVTTFTGEASRNNAGFFNGSPQVAKFFSPIGLFVMRDNSVLVADQSNQRIRIVDRSGFVGTVAGTGSKGQQDGTPINATFFNPSGITVWNDTVYYVADTGSAMVRKIDTVQYQVSTLAGSVRGYQDGQGNQAQFQTPAGIAIDSKGQIYVADYGNHCIRKITPQGLVSTVAGTCQTSGYKDGPALQAQFFGPQHISFDNKDNLYIADGDNHCIRKLILP